MPLTLSPQVHLAAVVVSAVGDEVGEEAGEVVVTVEEEAGDEVSFIMQGINQSAHSIET